jgi:putative ABC transport system ATP-binding protein
MGTEIVHALRTVSLEIARGEYVAIMGPSGSGKSTLMNLLGCLDTPTEGSYELNGVQVSRMNDNHLAEIRNREIGFVFQTFNLLARATALRNVELPLIYAGVATQERRQVALDALRHVGLADRVHHKPNELSGGQRQRVAIARALITGPDVIFADEPTGALDPHTATGVLRLLREAADGTTVVIVTHDPQVTRFCDQAVFLYAGRVDRVLPDPEPAVVARLVAELGERAGRD